MSLMPFFIEFYDSPQNISRNGNDLCDLFYSPQVLGGSVLIDNMCEPFCTDLFRLDRNVRLLCLLIGRSDCGRGCSRGRSRGRGVVEVERCRVLTAPAGHCGRRSDHNQGLKRRFILCAKNLFCFIILQGIIFCTVRTPDTEGSSV